MKEKDVLVIGVFMLWLFTLMLGFGAIEKRQNEINKLDKKNKELQVELHDYRWQIEQYAYMYNKYCGDGQDEVNN